MDDAEHLGFDMENDANIRLDLDDRPQKSPRACVIASDPPKVVHLITRAQGGLHDYQAFLHEAGHALHYAGCDPSLPYTFRQLSRDHALTEIYSYILEAITREPAGTTRTSGSRTSRPPRTRRRRRSSRRCSSAATSAKLQYELDFWSRLHRDGGRRDGYAERLTDATGMRYRDDALPVRHGRRLLLGRLSPRVDPLGAAARVPRSARSARTGGGTRRPVSGCARSSARARGRRARRSRRGSASSRSTRARSWPNSAVSGRVGPGGPARVDGARTRSDGGRLVRPQRPRGQLARGEGRGAYSALEGEPRFPEFGIHLVTLGPGEPMAMYHWEADQEDFLVLAGEALLIVEGEERPLRQWDFVHCPAGTKHVIVGAGEGPAWCLRPALASGRPARSGAATPLTRLRLATVQASRRKRLTRTSRTRASRAEPGAVSRRLAPRLARGSRRGVGRSATRRRRCSRSRCASSPARGSCTLRNETPAS